METKIKKSGFQEIAGIFHWPIDFNNQYQVVEGNWSEHDFGHVT